MKGAGEYFLGSVVVGLKGGGRITNCMYFESPILFHLFYVVVVNLATSPWGVSES